MGYLSLYGSITLEVLFLTESREADASADAKYHGFGLEESTLIEVKLGKSRKGFNRDSPVLSKVDEVRDE